MAKDAWLYLASSSPRRAQLLEQIGVAFAICTAPVDETRRPDENPRDYVVRLALEKARQGQAHAARPLPVLGADTAVVLENVILGKPDNPMQARSMLAQLSGRAHQVFTAVAMVGAHEQVRLSESTVRMRTISEAELDAYAASGEGLDKAGAYAVQGKAAVFIHHIEGSYSGIMGLPLFETAELLRHFSIKVL